MKKSRSPAVRLMLTKLDIFLDDLTKLTDEERGEVLLALGPKMNARKRSKSGPTISPQEAVAAMDAAHGAIHQVGFLSTRSWVIAK